MTIINKISRRLGLTAKTLIKGDSENYQTRLIPDISPEEVAEAKEFFPMPKFFIFGYARSGTTLLARLIRLHPEVHCNWQAHFFTRPPLLTDLVSSPDVEAWLSRPSNRWNRGRDLSPVILRAMCDFILERDARREGKSVVGDKSPNVLLNGESVHHLHKLYPDGHVIYILRDGRDLLISHRFHSFINNAQHLSSEDLRIRDDYKRNPEPFVNGERSIFSTSYLCGRADSWVRNIHETEQAGRELFGQQYTTLRFEDLLKLPYKQMSLLWSFLGVDPIGLADAVSKEIQQNPDEDWQRQEAGDLVENLQKGKRGSWREFFTKRDRKIFKEIAGQTLIDLDYEKDLDW